MIKSYSSYFSKEIEIWTIYYLLFKSDGHHMINDIYAEIAQYVFLGFLLCSLVSIVFIFISFKKNEHKTNLSVFILVANTGLSFLYFYITCILIYDLIRLNS